MLHKNMLLGDGHIIHNWNVGDAAARDALVVSAADEGKVLYQQDTEAFYILRTAVPTLWVAFTPERGVVAAITARERTQRNKQVFNRAALNVYMYKHF